MCIRDRLWREARNHSDDCYFCSFHVTDYNSKNKKVIFYPNLPSDIRPVGHGPGLSVRQVPETTNDVVLDVCSDTQSDEDGQENEFKSIARNLEPQLFTQIKLNDLVRDLGLTKEKAELLGSRLKQKTCWQKAGSIYVYRTREQQSAQFF